jgi:hypothetical protein
MPRKPGSTRTNPVILLFESGAEAAVRDSPGHESARNGLKSPAIHIWLQGPTNENTAKDRLPCNSTPRQAFEKPGNAGIKRHRDTAMGCSLLVNSPE